MPSVPSASWASTAVAPDAVLVGGGGLEDHDVEATAGQRTAQGGTSDAAPTITTSVPTAMSTLLDRGREQRGQLGFAPGANGPIAEAGETSPDPIPDCGFWRHTSRHTASPHAALMNPSIGAVTMIQTHATIPTSTLADRRLAVAEHRGDELVDIHGQAGQLVAELSEGPVWADADVIVIRLIAEADSVAGSALGSSADGVPAIVRCRELAFAQRRMVAALGERAGHGAAEAEVFRARALLAELGELTGRSWATLRR